MRTTAETPAEPASSQHPIPATTGKPTLRHAAVVLVASLVMSVAVAIGTVQDSPMAGAAVPSRQGLAEAHYIQTLDNVTGWQAQTLQDRQIDLDMGHAICRMLATGQSGPHIVAQMKTWEPADNYSDAELSAAVGATAGALCPAH